MTRLNLTQINESNVAAVENSNLIALGIESEGKAKLIAQETIVRAQAAGETITVWLQNQIRQMLPLTDLLSKGYQSWKGTTYNSQFLFVNRAQALARYQIKKQQEAAQKLLNKDAQEVVNRTSGKKSTAPKNTDDIVVVAARLEKDNEKLESSNAVLIAGNKQSKIEVETLKEEIESLKKQLAGKNELIKQLKKENSASNETAQAIIEMVKNTKISRKALIQKLG